MKRIKLFIIMFIMMFAFTVKADMGPPVVAEHTAMVTNKNGAVCYESSDGKKTDKVLPYGKNVTIRDDISGSFILVDYGDDSCYVKYSDVSAKTQNYDLDGAEKITPVKAVILAKGGLNMRKGPSVTYSRIVTIPEHAIITLTHKSGSYWYYCEYDGKKGWITGMNGYFGYDGKEVLVSYEDVKIVSTSDSKKEIGKIPANTEVTDYVELVERKDHSYYVSYNGIKGYARGNLIYKTEGTGKIKLTKNYDVTTEYGDLIKKLTPQELEYTMISSNGEFYFPEKKLFGFITEDSFDYIVKAEPKVKKTGYIGEGLFGEKKEERKEEPKEIDPEEENNEVEPTKKESGMSTKEIIIICLLAGIFLSLTAIVVIKLVNTKKKTTNISYVKEDILNDNKENDENKNI